MTDACEMSRMLDLRAGRGGCLILARPQQPIDSQNLGTSPFLRIRGFGTNQVLVFRSSPRPTSHLICLGGKAKVRRNTCLGYPEREP
jgi:hypothetical protein